MYLHDSILNAIGWEGASGVKIFCNASKSKEVANYFAENFEKYWSEAQDAVEKFYGNCHEKEEELGSPARVKVAEFGVMVSFDPLYLSYNYGDESETEGYAEKALAKALKKLIKKYPDISYEGYIGFRWSDTHGGDVTQYEVSSKNSTISETNTVYDFVGKSLASAIQYDDFWEEMENELGFADAEEFKQVLKCFHAYENWIPQEAFEKLLDLADDIRPELESILEAWKNGENVEIGDEMDSHDKLPDGYMEALQEAVRKEVEKRDVEIDAELEEEEE